MKTSRKAIRIALFSLVVFFAFFASFFLVSCGESTSEKWEVTWKNYDGTVLKTVSVKDGETPTYKGDTPVKPSTDMYHYEFIGWDPEVKKATKDQTYTAQFKEIAIKSTYTITWKNYDGSILKTDEVNANTLPIYDGETPVKPNSETHYYVFIGWSPEVKKADRDQTYTALFEETTEKYTITWKNYDGSVLKTHEVSANTLPVYDGSTPVKPDTESHSYIFIGWSPEVKKADKDQTYTAQFQETTRKYTIVWKNYDGSVLKEDQVEKGATPVYSGDIPKRLPVPTNHYEFVGWSPEVEPAQSNKEYVARFYALYPEKYELASDSDFQGDRDGQFIYIGTADYVMIPEYIKGVKVTSVSNIYNNSSQRILTARLDIKGIVFQVPDNITNMSGLFYDHESTEVELQYLNTSAAIDMNYMFYKSKIETLDLSNFNTDSATKMYRIFEDSKATSINLSSFNTSQVGDMSSMFLGSHATTLDLSSFDTTGAFRMVSMFQGAQATSINLSSFNTSGVNNMSHMFADSHATSLDLSKFNTSKVENMNSMFARSKANVLDLSSFDTSKIGGMDSMFADAEATSINLSSFNTKSVGTMRFTFANVKAETLDLSNFDTSSVYDMWAMFKDSKSTTLILTSFDTTNVVDMREMFAGSHATTLDLSSFDTSEVTDMINMFNDSKVTLGYARNQAEADKFNNAGGFNVFVVK